MNRTQPRLPGRPKTPVPRETLLATACRTFALEGYAGASMRTIAVAAGIRKSSLFHHFASKQALYDEVMVWLLGELGELIFKAIGGAHGYLERLDALGSMLVRFLAERPDAARVLLRELVNGGQSLDGRGREAIQNTMKITSAFLAEGMEAGAIARQDPRHLALSIAGLHLTYFAAAEVSSELLEGDVFSPELAEQRVQEVIGQVRRICGSEPS